MAAADAARCRRAGAVLLLAALASCGGAGGASRQPPVLVFGADGLEWSVIRPLMRQGRMPNLKALIGRGTAGWLTTDVPTFSPVLWTSIATGVLPPAHGILNFLEAGPDGVPRENGLPYTSECRRVPAIWNIADDAGRRVLSVAWWVSWPAEALHRGRIVASYAAQVQALILWKPSVWEHGLPELTWPPVLAEHIAPLLEEGSPEGPLEAEFAADFGRLPANWAFMKELEGLLRVTYRGDRTHVRIMRQQLEEEVGDLNLVYIGLPDVAGHFFWRYRQPEAYDYEVDPARIAKAGRHVDRSYEVFDRWLGEIVDAMPADARILVISDHGMHSANEDKDDARQSGAHEDGPAGVFIAAGPGIRAQGLIKKTDGHAGSIYDIAPTLLDWLGLPIPGDMPGRPLRRHMTEEWVAAHPLLLQDRSYAEGFRPPKPPREPIEGANEAFQEGILNQLGYAGAAQLTVPQHKPK